MGLSPKEREILERLSKKAEEPDTPPVGKSVSATVDLSDPKSVALAIKHGFLTPDEVEDLEDDDEEAPADEKPKRNSYFKD